MVRPVNKALNAYKRKWLGRMKMRLRSDNFDDKIQIARFFECWIIFTRKSIWVMRLTVHVCNVVMCLRDIFTSTFYNRGRL